MQSRVSLIFSLVFCAWVVELVNLALGHRLCQYGIYPRAAQGLIGIPLSPFLHGSVFHLTLNTIPFVVLGSLVALRGARRFARVSWFVVLVGGTGVWLIARPSFHVGASGLVFGYFGYLVAGGWYERSFGAVFVACVTFFLYGGMLWGVLPSVPYVSWEAHLCGLLAGVLAARRHV